MQWKLRYSFVQLFLLCTKSLLTKRRKEADSFPAALEWIMNALRVIFFVIKHDDSVKKPWCCDKKKATTVLQIKSDNMFITVEDFHSSYSLAVIAIHNPEKSK